MGEGMLREWWEKGGEAATSSTHVADGGML